MGSGSFEWAWNGGLLQIGYDVRGKGDTVVLLPALSTVSTRDEMHPLAEWLAQNFRTVMPEWPGFGAGRQPRLNHGPELHLAFLRAFREQVVVGPAAVVAAGHAAGYALALARRQPSAWTKIALIAPTWHGPLPTMMGGYRPLQGRVRTTLRLPGIAHALYRLNVATPVIAAMYRWHVYADQARVTPAFVAEKARVARRGGGRSGSAAFVTGALDLVRDRAAFVDFAKPPAVPIVVIYGSDTPRKSLAEIDVLVRLPGIASQRLAVGSLGLHEEHAHVVAEALRPFLHGQPSLAWVRFKQDRHAPTRRSSRPRRR